MNREEVVKHMIDYIEQAERDLQAASLVGEVRSAKADIVNKIIGRLNREVDHEN